MDVIIYIYIYVYICICLSSTAFPCANNVVHGYMIDSYGPVVTYIEDIMDDHGTLVLQYWGL